MYKIVEQTKETKQIVYIKIQYNTEKGMYYDNTR